jgi:ribulose 1,5-bisphosphate carboxylase large subunit-like protein
LDRIRAKYLIESPWVLEFAAESLARFQSAGTFTGVPGETADLSRRFDARVEEIRSLPPSFGASLPYLKDDPGEPRNSEFQRGEATISIPLETTGVELTSLLATVAGGVFGLRELTGRKLVDLELPPVFERAHPGPQFGIDGTRRLADVWRRPLIASIIKPNVGLTPEQTASIVAELAAAGVDFIKDDEKMTSPPYSPLPERVRAVMAAIDRHADKSGRRPLYAFNISTDDPEGLIRNHDHVLKGGGTCVMVSVNQVGFAGVHHLRRRAAVPIHAHRNGWDMWTRHPLLGMGFRAYQKLWRLAGVDHLHVNGIRNKFWEPDDSVVDAIRACLEPLFKAEDRLLPVVGSGMWAGQVPETFRRTRTLDLLYIAGGGIQGHPAGPGAGVRSIRQAWDAALKGIPLGVHARDHPELRQAIERFAKPGEPFD